MSRISSSIRLSLLAGLLALSMPLLTGCGALTPTAGPANSFVAAGSLSGKVHGGNQPIAGATISLYAAGTSGYGSADVLYAQTTSASDGTGSFSFTQTTSGSSTGPPASITSTYGCPTGSGTNPNPQMYLISTGGATQGVGNGTNSAAAFITALGPCSGVGSLFVNMNEVTSVGTMAALQQYFNPVTESFGYPAVDATFFANGQTTIANLVNIASGAAVTSSTQSAIPTGSTNTVTVTITPEVNQINTIANIMAACVNNTSNTAANCATLFADAVPPNPAVTSQPSANFSTITAANEDTLQALYFMLTNPTSGLSASNMSGLFALTSAQAPFQPNYSTAPTDWTIAVSYASTNTCTIASGEGTTNTVKFLNAVNDPAVDQQGNVWGDAVGSTSGLFEISAIGKPLTCGLGALADSPVPVVLDVNGNAWVGSATKQSSKYYLYKWDATAGTYSSWATIGAFAPTVAAADGNGNVFYVDTNGGVNEFASSASTDTPAAATAIAALGSTNAADLLFMQTDSSGDLWLPLTVGSNPSTLYEMYPSTNTGGATYLNGFQTGTISSAALYSPYGLAIGYNNGGTEIYASNGAGSGSSGTSYKWDYIVPGATGTATITNSAVELAGNYAARGMAVDGASNVWQANNNAATGNWVTGAGTSGLYSVIEITANGAAVSATSATGTGAYGTNTGGFQKPSMFLSIGARGVSIDPTGNVWVGQNSSTATNIMELVGAAVPVVTPLAYGAQQNKLGQMP